MTTTTIDTVDLDALAFDVADVNRANGWYDDARSRREDRILIVSEIGEALDAFRSWGPEDMTRTICLGKHFDGDVDDGERHDGWATREGHLCKPEGIGSELADVFIRVLDAVKRRGLTFDPQPRDLPADVESFADALDYLTETTYRHTHNDVLGVLYTICARFGVDLLGEYHRKLAYNRTRGFKHGGKRL